jgi:hypothetical protein
LSEPPAWVGEGLYCPFRVLELARGPGLAARVADRAPRVLGLSPTRYFQLLSRLLDRPEAADAEPELVARLRAVQGQRRGLRRSR